MVDGEPYKVPATIDDISVIQEFIDYIEFYRKNL
jgi:hypothetical protein